MGGSEEVLESIEMDIIAFGKDARLAHNNDIHADTMKEFAFGFSLPYIVLVIEIAIGVRYKKKYALKWKN